jgi:hypothetical protein
MGESRRHDPEEIEEALDLFVEKTRALAAMIAQVTKGVVRRGTLSRIGIILLLHACRIEGRGVLTGA